MSSATAWYTARMYETSTALCDTEQQLAVVSLHDKRAFSAWSCVITHMRLDDDDSCLFTLRIPETRLLQNLSWQSNHIQRALHAHACQTVCLKVCLTARFWASLDSPCNEVATEGNTVSISERVLLSSVDQLLDSEISCTSYRLIVRIRSRTVGLLTLGTVGLPFSSIAWLS